MQSCEQPHRLRRNLRNIKPVTLDIAAWQWCHHCSWTTEDAAWTHSHSGPIWEPSKRNGQEASRGLRISSTRMHMFNSVFSLVGRDDLYCTDTDSAILQARCLNEGRIPLRCKFKVETKATDIDIYAPKCYALFNGGS